MSRGELFVSWQRVVAKRTTALALQRAEDGQSYTFLELDAAAKALIAEYPFLNECAGRIWALSAKDPMQWMVHSVAALHCGAVLLPLESVRKGPSQSDLLQKVGAAYLLTDTSVDVVTDDPVILPFCLIKMTSGSTGEPTSIPFTESEMMADGRQIMETMGLDAGKVNYGIIPLGHSYGLGNLLMPFLMEGVSIVFGSAPFPQIVADEIETYGCSVLAAVPPLIKAFAESDLAPEQLSSLQCILSAGSRLSPEVARAFYERFGHRVHNFYGSSETGGICYDQDGLATLDGSSVGTPLKGVTLSIKDRRVHVESAAVSHALYPTGAVPVSDFGRIESNGHLCLEGRDSDLVKIAGKRLFLSEVERTLIQIEGVDDAVVLAKASRRGEDRLVAVYQGRVEPTVLRQLLLDRLVDWKVPRVCQQIPKIPYTARGKKDRTAILAWLNR